MTHDIRDEYIAKLIETQKTYQAMLDAQRKWIDALTGLIVTPCCFLPPRRP